VYFKADDNNFSYLNNFINDKYFYEIFKLFQKFEIDELKKNDNINVDKNNLYNKIENIKKKILNLKNHKLRKNFISDIICKITNNDIKWNQKTNLFTFENKIFDINLNQFINPLPEFFINISCGWIYDDLYDKNLVVELDNFIDTIHPNKKIKDLYLTILSTGLSGQTLEKFIIANGKGGNGKGVYNELALDTFGNYGYVLPSNVILQPLKQGSNPEIANCNFKRFVVTREPDDSFKINCATVKELTGGKDINARLNHSNNTETNLNLTLIVECNDKPKLSDVGDGMKRRVLDIPFNSSFVDKCMYDKLDDEFKSNTFISNGFYKSIEFRNKYKQALFLLLTEYYYEYNKYGSLNIPDEIEERTMNYISDSDEIFNIINDILEKTNDKTDTIKLKDIFEMAKSTDNYFNMTKEQKRNFNYKNFCSKLENNIFFKHYVSINSDKIKILKNYIKKNIENESNL
jgi:phage/plasmid-associated DNA primase